MKEIIGDLFSFVLEDGVDAICIPTSANYTSRGLAIMDFGNAKICAERWPETSKRLGKMLIALKTNVPFIIGAVDIDGKYLEPTRDLKKDKRFKSFIFSFPIINKFKDGTNIQLIRQSATLLKDYVNQFNLTHVISPRIGVDVGDLLWSDVKPIIEIILDDRFSIISSID